MSETKRKIFMIVVLLLVVLFGVGQFFAGINLNSANQDQATQNQKLPTQVVFYRPDVTASSTQTLKGSCFANSVAAPYRSDAWRCMAGNAISDPCFGISGSKVLCGADPASASATSSFVMEVTNQIPKSEVPSGTIPTNWAWMLELADGTVCTPFTGTRPFSATGEAATYSCTGGSVPAGSLIFGDLNNANANWTARIGLLSTATSTFPPAIIASATVPVAVVWQ